MSGLFGGADNSAAIALQQQQLELQKQQQEKLDAQERDRQAALLARTRAGASGGMRTLISGSPRGVPPFVISGSSLGNSSAVAGATGAPSSTLGGTGGA